MESRKRSRGILASAGRIVLLLALLYLPYCGAMAVFKDRLVFPQRGVREAQGRQAPFDARVVHVALEGGVRVEGWFFPAQPAPGPAVLFFHGNGELIDHHVETARAYLRKGWTVLLAEYPGYGRSSGEPRVDDVPRVAEAWQEVLLAQPEVDPRRVVLHGYSLGSAFAAQAARVRPPRALILESPFRSLQRMARRNGVWIYLAGESLDTEGIVRDYPGPVLVMHGKPDPIVPFTHGRAVAEAAGDRARFEIFSAGHQPSQEWDRYWRTIGEFLGGI